MNTNLMLLIGRILFSAEFLFAGFGKLSNAAGVGGYFTGLGLPLPGILPYLVGLFELLAGAAVLVGFQTRIAALLLAAFCIATAFIAHAGEPQELLKNFALAGGYIVLAAAGAGAYALDRRATVTPARTRI